MQRKQEAGEAGILSLAQVKAGFPLGPAPVVALGTFDGVHLAHQAVLQRTVELARALKGTPLAFTFDRHPAEALGRKAVPQLTPLQDKLHLLAAAGAHYTVIAPFTPEFARLEPMEFIEEVLVNTLRIQGAVCGFDFRFGRGAAGNAALLQEAGRARGFQVAVLEPVVVEGLTVSSTEIRRRLMAGDVERAAKLLGRPYRLRGQVVAGQGKGRELGFPTANLQTNPAVVLPGDGVYCSFVYRGDNLDEGPGHEALAVISTRPTFGANPRGVEVHLLDFSGNLYGETLTIAFRRFLRPITAFPGVDALREQMTRDVAQAREYFASLQPVRSG